MQLLLGLFFFSILLATGNSLSCETCASQGSGCSGSKKECPPNHDACMMVMGELTAGNSLSCETCASPGSDCSGSKINCVPNLNACMMVMGELTVGSVKSLTTWKGCERKDFCKSAEEQKGKPLNIQMSDIELGTIVKQVTCSRAPPSFASFFPAFLGLLLMKLLF